MSVANVIAAAPMLYVWVSVKLKLGDSKWANSRLPAPSSASRAPHVRDGQLTATRAVLRAVLRANRLEGLEGLEGSEGLGPPAPASPPSPRRAGDGAWP